MKDKCERCDALHDGNYGSGRFCSEGCSRRRIYSAETKQKLSESIKKSRHDNPKVIEYSCERCGVAFNQNRAIRKGNKIHCQGCRRKRGRPVQPIRKFADLSKRTIGKIMKRANIGCFACGWNEARCDIHHVIAKSKGGSDENDNLINICPNCHRKAHENPTQDFLDKLKMNTIDKVFSNYYLFTDAWFDTIVDGTPQGGTVVWISRNKKKK
jgi:DNA-directed RNA polymerase subunit RPC12/RpoP